MHSKSAEKPFCWKVVRNNPQHFIKLNNESLTREETSGKRNITLNKVVQQLWKKTSKNYPVCTRYSETQCQSIMFCIKPRCISSSHQKEAAVVVTVSQLVLSSPFPCSVICPVLIGAYVPWNIFAICNQHTIQLSCNFINHPGASV